MSVVYYVCGKYLMKSVSMVVRFIQNKSSVPVQQHMTQDTEGIALEAPAPATRRLEFDHSTGEFLY
jgi:hypothetical protein